MPMPKPNKGESKDDFISRFMADEIMADDFPDEKQRLAVANQQWDKANKASGDTVEAADDKPAGKSKSFESTEEIFAVGKWNGMEFGLDDLKQIESAFKQMRDVLAAPLKLGHSGDKDLREGQPALGWVSDVWIDEQAAPPKLMAKFEGMPEIVKHAMDKKLYRNKSIELDLDVSYKGASYPYVLTGVALLGSELPAVNVLNDLGAYMSASGHGAYFASSRIEFNASNGAFFNNEGGSEMNEAEYKAEIEQLKADLKAATAEKATFQARADAAEAEIQRVKFEARVDGVKASLESLVEAGKLTPAKRDEFNAMLTDDAGCERVEFAAKIIGEMQTATFASAQGGGAGSAGDSMPADERVAVEVAKVQAELKCDYFTAQQAVFRRDPELARAYINMT